MFSRKYVFTNDHFGVWFLLLIASDDHSPIVFQAQAINRSTGRTLDIEGFIVARGRNNMASGNAPNEQGAAGNRALS
jgi:hypothetical protein